MAGNNGNQKPIDKVSDVAYRAFVATALLAPLVTFASGKQNGKTRSKCGGDGKDPATGALDGTLVTVGAMCAGLLASEAVKKVVTERRPDGSNNQSFPSGHAVATLAVTEAAAMHDPDHAKWWYTGAGVVSLLRATSDKHYLHDVLAGGLLGFLVSRYGVCRIGRKVAEEHPRDPDTGRFTKRRRQ